MARFSAGFKRLFLVVTVNGVVRVVEVCIELFMREARTKMPLCEERRKALYLLSQYNRV